MEILNLVGNTPLVRITYPNGSNGIRILGKLEGNNPGGSVKDRIAYYMIEKAEKDGLLSKEKVILEPTSGNTGIGLSMVAALQRVPVLADPTGMCQSGKAQHVEGIWRRA